MPAYEGTRSSRTGTCRSRRSSRTWPWRGLTYWGFGTPVEERTGFAGPLLGKVPYLSGSLFYPHPSERLQRGQATWAVPELSNQLFEEALATFQRYRWTIVEEGSSEGAEGVITPAFLGTLAEHHVENRKRTGTYYTPVEICTYMVRETCEPLIVKQYEQLTGRHCDSVDHLLDSLDERDCALLLFVVLPTLAALDPACGAGDFLVIVLDRMTDIYRRVIERAESLHHPLLDGWIADFDGAYPCREFGLRKRVACRNLYGVDIQQAPLDVTKLRLALSLLKCVGKYGEELALPNLDYRLPRGNSLVGIDRISEREQALLAEIHPGYGELVEKRNELIRIYQSAVGSPAALAALRTEIDDRRASAYQSLNRVLLERLDGKQAPRRGKGGSRSARTNPREPAFTLDRLLSLDPFHWAFDFSEVMQAPFWARLDGEEAEVVPANGRFMVRFGPQRGRPSAP